MAAITCESLTKTFKKVTVLNDITLTVEENTLCGVLGADGAGKTTLLKLLTGLVNPTSGSCRLFEHNVTKDPAKALQNVGCLVGEPGFYHGFTAEQNVRLFADLVGAAYEAGSPPVDMSFGTAKVEHLTQGMKKQLGVAVALLGDPALLILDEPLTALDAPARTKMRDLFQSLAEKEKTIFFTTHNPEDIKGLATEAVILKDGEITAYGPTQSLNLDQLTEVNT